MTKKGEGGVKILKKLTTWFMDDPIRLKRLEDVLYLAFILKVQGGTKKPNELMKQNLKYFTRNCHLCVWNQLLVKIRVTFKIKDKKSH